MNLYSLAYSLLSGQCGNVNAARVDGAAVNATFSRTMALAVDGEGLIYVADWRPHNALRLVNPVTGWTQTLAGTGAEAQADGAALTAASFDLPLAVAVNSARGVAYVVDGNGNNWNSVRVLTLGYSVPPGPSAPPACLPGCRCCPRPSWPATWVVCSPLHCLANGE